MLVDNEKQVVFLRRMTTLLERTEQIMTTVNDIAANVDRLIPLADAAKAVMDRMPALQAELDALKANPTVDPAVIDGINTKLQGVIDELSPHVEAPAPAPEPVAPTE